MALDEPELVARNNQVDWNSFDSEVYCNKHYGHLRDDDQEIAGIVRDFFAENCTNRRGLMRRAVDVGPGSNLYPSLAMLPFSHTIELYERAWSNVTWLRQQRTDGFGTNWDAFWDVYQDNPVYRRYAARTPDVRADFRRKIKVRSGNVFRLPARRWDLGTMFFVACSLSSQHSEFVLAIRGFVRSLKPGAPFAIAFMINSHGYHVGDGWFPAVPVDKPDIEAALIPAVSRRGLQMRAIASHDPVRPEVGMLLATGFAA